MNGQICEACKTRGHKRHGAALRKMMRSNHRAALCHGQAFPDHALVKDGHARVILGWSMAGFFPECWELVNAMWGSCSMGWQSDWGEYAQQLLKPHCRGYAIMGLVKRVLG